MNREVWKFQVKRDEFINLPVGAEILHADCQFDLVYVWALVDPEYDRVEARDLRFFGTGEPVPPNWAYVATAMSADHRFVWHVFEKRGRTVPADRP